MSFYSALLTPVYVASILLPGWVIAARLGISSAAGRLGWGTALGLALSMVLTNALGYVIPIQAAFWFVPAALLIVGIAGLRSMVPVTDHLPRMPLIVLGTITILAGIANARWLGSDPWAWSTLPLIATIRDGNFPVHQIPYPDILVTYHYGPQLLAAATAAVTGLSPAGAYNIQPILCILAGLFSMTALVRALRGSWRGSLLVPVLFFAGGSLIWFKGIWLIRDLILLVSGSPVSVPFKWLAPMFGTLINPSLSVIFGSRSYTFGFPFLAGLFLCLFHLFEMPATDRNKTIGWGAAAVIFALGLALSTETAFVIFIPALLAYLACRRFLFGRKGFLRSILIAVVVLVISLLLARYQGGVFSVMGKNADMHPGQFFIGFTGIVAFLVDGTGFRVWSWDFLQNAGLPLLLLPFIGAYAWRRRRVMPFLIFLFIFAAAHLGVLFLVHYAPRRHETLRIGVMGFSLLSLLLGFMLSSQWWSTRSRRVLRAFIVSALVLSASIYLVMRLFLPTMRFERAPLFASMPPISKDLEMMYDWVRSHTTQQDLFYIRTVSADPTQVSEEFAQQRDRIVFMAYTGRFAIGFLNMMGAVTPEQRETEARVESSCDLGALEFLGVRYLVIPSLERAQWFKERCVQSEWVVRYDSDPAGTSGFPRVYESTLIMDNRP